MWGPSESELSRHVSEVLTVRNRGLAPARPRARAGPSRTGRAGRPGGPPRVKGFKPGLEAHRKCGQAARSSSQFPVFRSRDERAIVPASS
jgi:hypothetical protein